MNFIDTVSKLDTLYEGYDPTPKSTLSEEERKEAREKFKELNKAGKLDYDVFHTAYDQALKDYVPQADIDSMFNEEGELTDRKSYGTIKYVSPSWLSAVLKQLWSLAFVKDVVASRKEYADKKATEKAEAAKKEKEGKEAYIRDKEVFDKEAERVTLQANLVYGGFEYKVLKALKDILDPDVLEKYLKACKADKLEDCINFYAELAETPWNFSSGLVYEYLAFNNEDSETHKSFERQARIFPDGLIEPDRQYMSEPFGPEKRQVSYVNPIPGKFNFLVRYKLNKDKAKIYRDQDIVDYWVDKFRKIIEFGVERYYDNTSMTEKEFFDDNGLDHKKIDDALGNNINIYYVRSTSGGIAEVGLNKDHEIIKSYENREFFKGFKPVEIVGAKYNFKSESIALSIDSSWNIAIKNSVYPELKRKLCLDQAPSFGSEGGEEREPIGNEKDSGFDRFFDMRYAVDTSD